MSIKVKICGITRLEDAIFAAAHGADLLGFNFYPGSKRFIEPDAAADICTALREEFDEDCPLLVGLFVNASYGEMSAIKNGLSLDAVQMSGDEDASLVMLLRGSAYKAIRPEDVEQATEQVVEYSNTMPAHEKLPSMLVDAYHPELYGGTGIQAADEVALAVKAQVPRLMLAGGLTPENVAARIVAVEPWGVDVASGVESDTPGIKDHTKLKKFIQAAKHGRTV